MLYLLTALSLLASCQAYDWDELTALDHYVQSDDGHFEWTELGQHRFDDDGVTVYLLNMTSQKWMDESFSSQSIWWHMMGVAIPDVVRQTDVSYLLIDGGGNGPNTQPPGPGAGIVNAVRLASNITGYVASFVLQVPNQGIVFVNDPTGRSRTEDAVMAWTWHEYFYNYRDTPEVIARMPMTKSVKSAMDAITEFLPTKVPGAVNEKFIVGGGSKRGWTTWSIAATDQRVIAITPFVMSLMNFNDTLQSHYRNMGGAWSWVFNDYWELNLTVLIHDDQVTNWEYGLWTYEDMYRYKERLNRIPIYLTSACGDEFFLATDHKTWFQQMGHERMHLQMVPNAEHSLAPWYIKIGNSIASWFMAIVEERQLPKLSWLSGDQGSVGRISFHVDQIPDNITAWYAHTWSNNTQVRNHDRKDFRLAVGYPPFIHPVLWRRTPVHEVDANGNYDVEIDIPEKGFAGIFIECTFVDDYGLPMYLTTEVHATPDIFPADPCYADGCYGYLI